jgi:hypothetical protein
MEKRYTSHTIPKQNSKGFRVIHEFKDVEKHTESLRKARLYYIKNPVLSREDRKISFRSSVHGYPYGNVNMIDLIRRFTDNHSEDKWKNKVLCSFDLSNFYHYITPDKIDNTCFPELRDDMQKAFVEVGNGIVVLAQGSPLSQDISNICLMKTDLKALSIISTFNTWTGRFIGSRRQYPINFNIGFRHDLPFISTTPGGYLHSLDTSIPPEEIDNLYDTLGTNNLLKASYMRYVDNIYIMISGTEEVPEDLLIKISEALTKRIKGAFLEEGYSINNLKNNTSTSMTNRRMPILGLNISERVKCTKHYINNLRSGLFKFTQGAWVDIPESLASSVIYAMYVDTKSHNRLRKCTEKIRLMDLTNSPNALMLLRFLDSTNTLTNDTPSTY